MDQPDEARVRLNKHLALTRGISRRQADELIDEGRITINDQQAMLGARFNPAADTVKLNGELLEATPDFVYLALNKPPEYVSSRRAQGDSPTIYELLPEEFHTLKPVGRLDRDSSGLLLLTNDGDFAYQMTHPKFHKTKTYQITLDHALEPLHRQMISDHGVLLDDGPSKLQLERQVDSDNTRWIVSMHEGRNRQIRRTFNALGYNVPTLHRTQFGTYQIGDLAAGSYEIIAK